VWRIPARSWPRGKGQLPILIYWNPPLPISYPIPSRTGDSAGKRSRRRPSRDHAGDRQTAELGS